MAEDSGQEKTEQPTSKRLRDAKEKGDIARSKELATTILLLAAAAAAPNTAARCVSLLADFAAFFAMPLMY